MPRFPPFVIRWIIASACWKFFIRRFTSCTVVPLPAAIRFRRLPLRIRAFRRSWPSIESMMATTRFNSRLVGRHPLQLLRLRAEAGIIPRISSIDPIFLSRSSWSRKSSSVNSFFRSFRSSSFACFSSTWSCAFSTK